MMDKIENLEIQQIDFYNILGTSTIHGDDEEVGKGKYISKELDEFLPLQLSSELHGFGKEFDPNRRLSYLREQPIPARSIRISLEDGLQLGWAPNGYGKTFVFEQLLQKLAHSKGFVDYVEDVKSSIETTIKTITPFSGIGLLAKKETMSYAILLMAPSWDATRNEVVIDAYCSEISENTRSETWVYSMGSSWEHAEVNDAQVIANQPQHLVEEALLHLLQYDFKYLEVPRISSNGFAGFLKAQAREIESLLPEKSSKDTALFDLGNILSHFNSHAVKLKNGLIQQLKSNHFLSEEQVESLSITVSSLADAIFEEPSYPGLILHAFFKDIIDLRFQRERINRSLIVNILDEIRVEFESRHAFPENPEHVVYHDLAQMIEIHTIYGAYADILADYASSNNPSESAVDDFFKRLERGLNSKSLYTKYRSAVLLPYLWPSISDICDKMEMDIPKTLTNLSSENIVSDVLNFVNTPVPIGNLFSHSGALIERANEGQNEMAKFMLRIGEDAELVDEVIEQNYAFTPADAERGDESRFFSETPTSLYHSLLWPQLYPKKYLDLQNLLQSINQNLNTENDPWGVRGEFIRQEEPSESRFVFRPATRPSDEIPPEILSFGMRSEVVLQIVLARFLDGLGRHSPSDQSRRVLIIDESEVGRSEYWTHLLIERLNLLEREMLGRERATILVISHRGLVLEEARLDGEYNILHPVPLMEVDDETETIL